MKRGILFLVLVAAFSACKVREKKPAETVVKDETPRNVDKPVVNSVTGKYNFIDSTSTRVFIKAHITLLGEKMSMEKLNESFRVQWALQTDFGIREKISAGKLAFTPEFARAPSATCPPFRSHSMPRTKRQSCVSACRLRRGHFPPAWGYA